MVLIGWVLFPVNRFQYGRESATDDVRPELASPSAFPISHSPCLPSHWRGLGRWQAHLFRNHYYTGGPGRWPSRPRSVPVSPMLADSRSSPCSYFQF